MSWKLEQNRWIDMQQSVLKKTDNFWNKNKYENIQKNVKQKVEILEILDELEVPEENQEKILKKILKYNLINEVKEALDKNEIFNLIHKKEVETEKKEVETEKKKTDRDILVKENVEKNLKKVLIGNKEENKKTVEENKKTAEENKKTAEEKWERNNDLIEFNKNEDKIKKILLTINWLNENHPLYWNIVSKIKNFDIEKYKNESPEKVLEEFKKILDEFKQDPRKLQAVVEDLWWVGSENYEKFKSSVLSVDSSFGWYFKDIENLNSWKSLDLWEIASDVENGSWGIVDLDLDENPPVNKMHLIGSEYSFKEKIDSDKLREITSDSSEELGEIKKFGFDVLKDFYKNFWKETFDFSKMQDLYDYFYVDSSEQIELNDIEDFRNAENQEEKKKIFEEKISPKFKKLIKIVSEKQAGIYKKYEEEIKKILTREKTRKKEQLEILKFLHSIWFDLIPQQYTDKLIKIINNSETLKAKFGFDQNINLQNWQLWINKDSNLQNNSILEKQIFAKFVNKVISWDEKFPIDINSMTHWIPIFKNENWEEILNKQAYINEKLKYWFNSILENLKINIK